MSTSKPCIQDRIRLRYRGEGHLRFDLPPELCRAEAAEDLERRVAALEGVRRVVVYRRSRKLSIRFLEAVCGVKVVARHLYGCAPKALQARVSAGREETRTPSRNLKSRLLKLAPVKAAKARYQELKETAQSLVILARVRLGKDASEPLAAERDVLIFLNDLVAFYLIKLHWRQIASEWLQRPFAHRYQWLTLIYLVFLMVRFRKGGK